jgi:glutaredoxin
VKVTLFSRPECHLCADALRELEQLQQRYPHELEIVDITADDGALQSLYGERIPVLRAGGREYGAPLTRAVLERALRGATP